MNRLAELLLAEPGGAPARPPRRLSEADLKYRIRASKGRKLFLSEEETTLLARILERNDVDPFGGTVRAQSFLSPKDLSNLSLSTPSAGDQPGEGEEYDFSPEMPSSLDTANPAGSVIPIEHAVVAPNATPHAEEEIPPSVLVALDALRSSAPEQHAPAPVPVTAAPSIAAQPAAPSAPATPPPAAPEAVGSAGAPVGESGPKKKLTDADLIKAMGGIVGGGRPGMMPRRPLDESGQPVPAGQHLDPQDWAAQMSSIRRKKNGDDEPRQRGGPRVMESAESGGGRRKGNTAADRAREEAHRKAQAAMRQL